MSHLASHSIQVTNTTWAQNILDNGAVATRFEEAGFPEPSTPLPIPKVTLSKEQNDILEVVMRGGNVFFTGPAGTGKSVLLRAIIKKLLETENPETIAITATTGIAALPIGGQTIHSFGGIGTGSEMVDILLRKIRRKNKERWRRTKVLIIDEISMLKSELFDKLEHIARCIRTPQRDKPFGGIQLVFAGDFFQLPPVGKKGCAVPPDYVFNAETWKRCIPHPFFLREVFRQKDHIFVDILSSMRLGSLNPQQLDILRSLSRPLPGGAVGVEPAFLLSSRAQVAARNNHQLGLLQGSAQTYLSMDCAGWDVYRKPVTTGMAQNRLNSGTLALEKLVLKEGAQVMLIQNVVQGALVNGSIGKVVGFMTINEAQGEGFEISTPSNNDEDDDSSNDGLDYDEDADFRKPPTQPILYPRAYIEEQVLSRYSADPSIAERPTLLRDITGHVFPPNKKYPVVQFANDRRLLCVPMFFDHIGLMGNIEARRIQVPLLLSWAITIHKSQGQTLDFVKVDFEKIFSHGQAYVAVSRATSMDGLQLINFQPDKIHASPRVLKWHNDWQGRWEAEAERQPIAKAATDNEPIDNALPEESRRDAELFDSYNREIPKEWLEEHESSVEVASDSSWMEDAMMDDDSDTDDESYYDSFNKEILACLLPADD